LVTATNRFTGSSIVVMGSMVSGCAMKFVMRSSIDRGSRIKVGSVTRLKSAPGRSCDMMCESTASDVLVSIQTRHLQRRRTVTLVFVHDRLVFLGDLIASTTRLVHRGRATACILARRSASLHVSETACKTAKIDALVSDVLRICETPGRCGMVALVSARTECEVRGELCQPWEVVGWRQAATSGCVNRA
jgi:hypothetical protein